MSSAPATASGAGPEAPATHVGVDAVPPGAQGAPNNPKEQASVTAQICDATAYARMQMMFLTSFAWSSDQRPGTILWKIPNSPVYMNELIRYISKLYNIWAGGFAFEFVIAGTGFNGGKLMFGVIPPNKFQEGMSLAELTYYPYMIIDPKMNQGMVFATRDQRIQKAHWANFQPAVDTTGYDDQLNKIALIGGWAYVAVLNPLIVATGAPSSVNVSIFNKLGEDFVFSQVVPPQSVDAPLAVHQDFHFDSARDLCLGLPLTHMKFSTFSESMDIEIGSCVDVNGKYTYLPKMKRWRSLWCSQFSSWQYAKPITGDDSHYLYQDTTFNPSVDDQGCPHNFYFKFPNVKDDNGSCFKWNEESEWFRANILGLFTRRQLNTSDSRIYQIVDYDGGALSGDKGSDTHVSVWSEPGYAFHGYMKACNHHTPWVQEWQDTIKVESDIGESLVTFGFEDDFDTAGFPLPANFVEALRRGEFRHATSDPVFSVNDLKTGQPIAYMRFNPKGFFTTAKQTKIQKFKLIEVYLKFFAFLDHTSLLPTPDPKAVAAFESHKRIEDLERKLRTLTKFTKNLVIADD